MTCLNIQSNAKYMTVLDILRQLRSRNVITEAEYSNAKKYYHHLLGADIVVID